MSTNYIDQITDTAGTTHDISEGDSTRIFRAKCSTAASTAAKVATLDTSNRNFSLTAGVRVAVTFTYGNSTATPTLRVDGSSTGTAKTIAIWASDSSVMTAGGTSYYYWGPYETIIFTYNGTYWVRSDGGAIYKAYALANSKTANTGTVTSIGITNGGGLSITGSPVTNSGSITVGHSNSVTAQTTQAVYPIKIDAQGHISAYGSAVTIPTDTNTTYSLSNALSSHKFTWTFTAGGSGSGSTTTTAELVAGTGISLTDDTTNKKITITSTATDEKLKLSEINTSDTYYPVLSSATTTAETKLYTNLFEFNRNSATEVYFGVGKLNTTLGKIRLYTAASGGRYGIITPGTLTDTRTYTLPDKTGTVALTSDIPSIPTSTDSATTGITATTTATKTTLGTANSVTGVSGSTIASKASGSNGSASNWVFEDVACDDITDWSAGSGSASLIFTMDTTDTKKLVISFSHSHTAPSLTYSAKTASHVKSGGNGTAPSWSFTDVTVPKAAASATSIPNVSVTSATVTITDNGHTHTI